MSPLINTIVTSASRIVDVPATVAGALAAVAIGSAAKRRSKSNNDSIDWRTLKDIGIEKGSITWIS